jgi:hypothetical protein
LGASSNHPRTRGSLIFTEWRKVVPKDPYLLRRIGDGDMWVVVAHWDLTEVERAALAHRLNLQ